MEGYSHYMALYFCIGNDFFKKEVKGIWKASLYCGGGDEKIGFSYEFKARIVGECGEKIK